MGALVDLSHVAATPMGMRVTAQVEIVAEEGRKLRFKLECQDEKEQFRCLAQGGGGGGDDAFLASPENKVSRGGAVPVFGAASQTAAS